MPPPQTPEIPATQRRVLAVLDAVLKHGPITLEQLTAILPISQSGIYRALQNLIAIGWIQPASLRQGFVIAAAYANGLNQCAPSFPYPRDGKFLKKIIQKVSHIDLDIALLRRTGAVYRVETTRPGAFRPHSLTLTDSILARAAVSALPAKDRMVFLRRYLAAAPEMERERSRKPHFTKLFSFPNNRRFILGSMEPNCAFAFQLKDGEYGALQINHRPRALGGQRVLYRSILAILDAQNRQKLPNMQILLDKHEIDTADI
ncbi:MAG: hypothetical protein AAF701_00205 [Pseudomonadota bacterium]